MSQSKTYGVYFGHIVGAVACIIFFSINSSGLTSFVRGSLIAAGIATLLITLIAAVHTPKELREKNQRIAQNFGSSYRWVMLATIIILLGGFRALNLFNEVSNVAWIGIVIGIHFIVLSYKWLQGNPNMRNLGIAMTVLGVIGLYIGLTTNNMNYVACVAGLSCGACLLVSSLVPSVKLLMHKIA